MGLKHLVDRLESDTPQGPVAIRRLSAVEVTADEVREAISANPHHPLAWIFSGAVEGLDGDAKLFCDKADILGLAKNLAVLKRRQMVDGELHVCKELGESLAPKKPSESLKQTASQEATAAEAPAPSSPRTPRPKAGLVDPPPETSK